MLFPFFHSVFLSHVRKDNTDGVSLTSTFETQFKCKYCPFIISSSFRFYLQVIYLFVFLNKEKYSLCKKTLHINKHRILFNCALWVQDFISLGVGKDVRFIIVQSQLHFLQDAGHICLRFCKTHHHYLTRDQASILYFRDAYGSINETHFCIVQKVQLKARRISLSRNNKLKMFIFLWLHILTL